MAHSLIGGAVVVAGGFKGFEKVMKGLIATMFFSIIACAALTFSNPETFLRGLSCADDLSTRRTISVATRGWITRPARFD